MLRLWILVFFLLLSWAEQLQLTQVQHLLVLIHFFGGEGSVSPLGIFICLMLLIQLLMGLLVLLFLFLN